MKTLNVMHYFVLLIFLLVQNLSDLKVDDHFVSTIVKVYKIDSFVKKYKQLDQQNTQDLDVLDSYTYSTFNIKNNKNTSLTHDDFNSPKSIQDLYQPLTFIPQTQLPECQSSIYNLSVFDQSASMRLQLLYLTSQQQEQLQQGSVITIINGQTLIDKNEQMILSVNAQGKYSKIALYSKDDEIREEFCKGVCDHEQSSQELALIMMNNRSTQKILVKEF